MINEAKIHAYLATLKNVKPIHFTDGPRKGHVEFRNVGVDGKLNVDVAYTVCDGVFSIMNIMLIDLRKDHKFTYLNILNVHHEFFELVKKIALGPVPDGLETYAELIP